MPYQYIMLVIVNNSLTFSNVRLIWHITIQIKYNKNEYYLGQNKK